METWLGFISFNYSLRAALLAQILGVVKKI